jgi:magnesium transporter
MKTLTVFSVIVLPLNLLAGIFGMNVKNMPLVGMLHSFWIILGIMSLGMIIMIFIFYRKRWL